MKLTKCPYCYKKLTYMKQCVHSNKIAIKRRFKIKPCVVIVKPQERYACEKEYKKQIIQRKKGRIKKKVCKIIHSKKGFNEAVFLERYVLPYVENIRDVYINCYRTGKSLGYYISQIRKEFLYLKKYKINLRNIAKIFFSTQRCEMAKFLGSLVSLKKICARKSAKLNENSNIEDKASRKNSYCMDMDPSKVINGIVQEEIPDRADSISRQNLTVFKITENSSEHLKMINRDKKSKKVCSTMKDEKLLKKNKKIETLKTVSKVQNPKNYTKESLLTSKAKDGTEENANEDGNDIVSIDEEKESVDILSNNRIIMNCPSTSKPNVIKDINCTEATGEHLICPTLEIVDGSNLQDLTSMANEKQNVTAFKITESSPLRLKMIDRGKKTKKVCSTIKDEEHLKKKKEIETLKSVSKVRNPKNYTKEPLLISKAKHGTEENVNEDGSDIVSIDEEKECVDILSNNRIIMNCPSTSKPNVIKDISWTEATREHLICPTLEIVDSSNFQDQISMANDKPQKKDSNEDCTGKLTCEESKSKLTCKRRCMIIDRPTNKASTCKSCGSRKSGESIMVTVSTGDHNSSAHNSSNEFNLESSRQPSKTTNTVCKRTNTDTTSVQPLKKFKDLENEEYDLTSPNISASNKHFSNKSDDSLILIDSDSSCIESPQSNTSINKQNDCSNKSFYPEREIIKNGRISRTWGERKLAVVVEDCLTNSKGQINDSNGTLYNNTTVNSYENKSTLGEKVQDSCTPTNIEDAADNYEEDMLGFFPFLSDSPTNIEYMANDSLFPILPSLSPTNEEVTNNLFFPTSHNPETVLHEDSEDITSFKTAPSSECKRKKIKNTSLKEIGTCDKIHITKSEGNDCVKVSGHATQYETPQRSEVGHLSFQKTSPQHAEELASTYVEEHVQEIELIDLCEDDSVHNEIHSNDTHQGMIF